MPLVKLTIDKKNIEIECRKGEENLLIKAEAKLNLVINNHPDLRNQSVSNKFLMVALIIAGESLSENNNEFNDINRELDKLESLINNKT